MARALIVDDNAANRRLLQAFCNAFGLDADCAQSGPQALEYFAANGGGTASQGAVGEASDHDEASEATDDAYGIVLMDIHMPEMDGLETARRIRDLYRKTIPIVAVTADTTAENHARCLQAGLAEVVYKPISAQTLGPVLCRYMAI